MRILMLIQVKLVNLKRIVLIALGMINFNNINQKGRQMKQRTTRSNCSKNSRKNVVGESEGSVRSNGHQSLKKIKNGKLYIQKKKVNEYQKIKEIPEIQLSKQQMQGDPIKLMAFLQQNYKEYGAIKLKACPQWNSPFSLRYNEKPINTRVQKLYRLKQGKPFVQRIEEHTTLSFTQMAKEFQKNYKFKYPKCGSTEEACFQNQFWKNVNVSSHNQQLSSKDKTIVQYAADLPVNRFGSGFPLYESSKTTDQNFNYVENLFNLNNLYKSSSSIVKFSDNNHQKISGLTTPWVYMGMLFSAFCWHVQDLWLNSVNYSHMGSTKTWYIIPESDKQKFDNFILRTTGNKTFLQSITYMVDPLELIKEGIKVYKAYQRPTQYILTFFNAYHCGFSQGFNVGEAVNMISVQSLPVIRNAIDYNQQNKRRKPPVLCYQWLIVGNLGDKNIDKQSIQKEYKKLVSQQFQHLKKCIQRLNIRDLEFVDSHLKYDRMSCSECKYYQYLSILVCNDCNNRYCLQDAKKCCGKGFTFMARPFDKQRKQTYQLVQSNLH